MNEFNMNESFKDFQKYQAKLASILKDASDVVKELEMSKDKELADLSEKVQNDTFKIMVTGTFKNGKSTFINALLGEELLPAYALPCTAVINEVKYGEKKKAILHFRNPLPEILPEKLAPAAVEHMKRYKGKPIPPMEIPYDEIEDYVVIPMDVDSDQTRIYKLQSPYAKVELFYPLELLKNGVEIIDSPGLNEDETRTQVTMDYLPKIDAILYVLNANAICAGDEMRFVEKDLKGNGIDSVFFVVNRFDQIRERERNMIRQYAQRKLKELYPNPELFCVSALNALDGRLDKDEELVEGSGILPLEKRLTEFLTKEKGKAKLAMPAKQVRHILSDEAAGAIERQRVLLDTSLDEIKKKYELIQPKLQLAKDERNQKASKMSEKIARAERNFERMARRQMSNMIVSIPAWVTEYEPKNSLGIISKKKTAAVVEEISDYLQNKISEEMQDWQNDVLSEEIEATATEIFSSAEQDFGEIFAQIDSINVTLTGKEYSAKTVPFWQRVAGVAGGIMIGDIGLAFSGGVNGLGKEFAKTAALEVGAGFILAVLGLFNPVTLIATLVTTIFMNILASKKNKSKALETLKKQISDQAVQSLSDNAEKNAAAIVDGIGEKFRSIKNQIVDSVSAELLDLEKQLDFVIREKQKGESDVIARKNDLKKCEAKINDLNSRLYDLIFTLMGN